MPVNGLKRLTNPACAVVFAAVTGTFNVAAAQVIKVSPEAFIDTPSLPFAPAIRPSPPTAVPIQAVTPPAPPTFELQKGKRVDEQLRAYGKQAGWDVIWQASEFVVEQPQVLPGNFEESIEYFLRGANEAGIHLRGVFYRGNRTVRITEF